jgi:ubiquinone/menaquinone biosynthesis C-methylase UbiE
MKIDYDVLSKDYDITRNIKIDTIKRFFSKIEANADTNILDFGCGTGNYACAIKLLSDANVYGVEPSDGMRQKAQEKTPDIVFAKGDHTSIPFDSDFFDFIYMTDVIHHVPDMKSMFSELNRVLRPNGKVCIVTESYQQIETRFWSPYFPATVIVEKQRYPDVPDILSAAAECNFALDENMISDCQQKIKISPEFLNLVKNKGYSMFRLISETDYQAGLEKLEKDFENDVTIDTTHGETFLWLRKN